MEQSDQESNFVDLFCFEGESQQQSVRRRRRRHVFSETIFAKKVESIKCNILEGMETTCNKCGGDDVEGRGRSNCVEEGESS